MKNRYGKREERQLYTLFKQLDLHIDGERDCGQVISYSVLSSLLDFSSNSGSLEEVRFEQVKKVHSGLEGFIKQARHEDYYRVFCELKNRLDPVFEQYFDGGDVDLGRGTLLEDIFNRLKRGWTASYEDRLQRDGIALYHGIMRDGVIHGRKNIFIHDYLAMERFLVGGK